MISVDDFLKIILILSIAFAIVGISFQIMSFFSKLTKILEEIRVPVKNISKVSDFALEDYSEIRVHIKSIGNIFNNINKFMPSLSFFNLFKKTTKEKESKE